MGLKDVLVHVDDFSQTETRVRAALSLAGDHGAHLTGIYPVPKPYIPPYAEVHLSQEILDAQAQAVVDGRDAARAAFEQLTANAGVSVEWREQEGEAGRVLGFHSRYTDLTIVSQPDPQAGFFPGDRDMPDRLILSAGRPILVIPHIGPLKTIGKRVMVAWDGGMLASRALHDAMPVLEQADEVIVMVVNPERESEGGKRDPGADISLHLARHGLKVTADHITSDEVDTGNQLLSRAFDLSVDLMVMGAYGHARWSELLLGGVTNRVLSDMNVPVLMSH